MTRFELQAKLESLLGTRNVYFQPPSSIQLKYPCIVYKLADFANEFANNTRYASAIGYEITVIDLDPDSKIPEKIGALPYSRFVTHFVSNNLNHFIYSIYTL